jgi:protein-arginine kinase activator protein McsA
VSARKFSKAVDCHNCGNGFSGDIIKTRKGIYCSFCGQVFPEGITPLLIKNKSHNTEKRKLWDKSHNTEKRKLWDKQVKKQNENKREV